MTKKEKLDLTAYVNAQVNAESEGKNEFVCPICGGRAMWTRSEINGHLFSQCNVCHFTIME